MAACSFSAGSRRWLLAIRSSRALWPFLRISCLCLFRRSLSLCFSLRRCRFSLLRLRFGIFRSRSLLMVVLSITRGLRGFSFRLRRCLRTWILRGIIGLRVVFIYLFSRSRSVAQTWTCLRFLGIYCSCIRGRLLYSRSVSALPSWRLTGLLLIWIRIHLHNRFLKFLLWCGIIARLLLILRISLRLARSSSLWFLSGVRSALTCFDIHFLGRCCCCTCGFTLGIRILVTCSRTFSLKENNNKSK